MERNSRRRGWAALVEVTAAEMTVDLGLRGGRDLGVEVGVMRVGEAMMLEEERSVESLRVLVRRDGEN